MILQEGAGLLQALPFGLGLGRQLLEIAAGVLGPLLGHVLLHLAALQRQVRAELGEAGQQVVHVLLVLEIALLFAAVVLHHQVGDGAEGPLAGEAALAHGHALEHAAHRGQRHIIVPVDEKAVEIQGLFAHAAGAEAAAALLIRRQGLVIQRDAAKACRCKDHSSSSHRGKAAGGACRFAKF